MIQLAEDVFAVRNDPDQIDVNEEVLERLRRIHPSTVSEYNDGNGPAAWLLLIPTTSELMLRFLEHKISERELFDLTPLHSKYEALYLCSAMVLEEYRRKGITKRLALKAIEEIQKDHPLKAMFVWSFTEEGDLAADALAKAVKLPLYKKG
ncbi:MAG TPA: GNAT family N-acetyltransferase [Saprospiraceae bacterium]|nr:GNAT family N-acetyltransferase [Saprospiraceae bacterium]